MTDLDILLSWLEKTKANYEEGVAAYDGTPFVAIWLSNETDENLTFYFDKDGTFQDIEHIE